MPARDGARIAAWLATSPPWSAVVVARSPRWPPPLLAVLRLRARRGIATADPAGHLRRAAHRRAGRRAAARRADARPARRRPSATCGPWSARPGWRSPTPTGCSPSTGAGAHHGDQLLAAAARAVRHRPLDRAAAPRSCPATGSTARSAARWSRRCRRRTAGLVGALVAVADGPPAPGLVQATLETARWAGTQLALAELDSSRERLARAEVRALRAQISPHFIYNALTAIALVRAHRPGAGPGADPGVRRVHPVLVPGARRVHHARRGAALDRPVPDHRAGPVRRPAAGAAADRPRGAAGGAAVPLPAAAGGERGPARAVPQAGHRAW